MGFTTQNLVNDRVLVQGTDVFGTSGKTVLNAEQWNELGQRKDFSQAEADFQVAVDAFFAPLTEAADAVKAKMEKPTDSIGYLVFEEAVEGVPAKPGTLIKLTHDSVLLRLLESGDTDRLVWVDESLEVLEVAVPVQASGQPSAAEVGAEITGIELDEV
jgi:hypothetical protein